MRKTLVLGLVVVAALIVALAMSVTWIAAEATKCVPKEAWTETVVDKKAYDETIPGTPGLWWNWSPNKDQGPFDGPPAFPNDPRGTWQGPHTNGGPEGEGTYQPGIGNGPWFHREPGTPDTVIHHPAVTHEVQHPAVVCPKPTETPIPTPPISSHTATPTPPVETETPPVETETPKPTPNDQPKKPQVNPIPKNKYSQSECLGGALVTKHYVDGEFTGSDTDQSSDQCESDEPVIEEGF